MRKKDCPQGLHDETHLFSCPTCHSDSRLARAWKRIAHPASLETPVSADELFVQRVLGAVRRDRARVVRRRLWTVAAAALLFFFFAGLAEEGTGVPAASAEESYSTLLSPSSLDGLIPN